MDPQDRCKTSKHSNLYRTNKFNQNNNNNNQGKEGIEHLSTNLNVSGLNLGPVLETDHTLSRGTFAASYYYSGPQPPLGFS